MDWNNSEYVGIDYSRPIKAIEAGSRHILLPNKEAAGSYAIAGYDWFNIDTGEFNSTRAFKTQEEAVRAYSSYTISNTTITLS